MVAKTANRSLGLDFTDGPIMPLLLRFFTPFLLSYLLNSIYNTVDTIVIGQFVGSTGIIAVTMGGKMLNAFSSIGIAFAGGAQIYISQLVGAKRREEYNSTIGTVFTQMLILSVFFACALMLFSRQLLVWLNTPEEAFEDALSYLRVTCIGFPLIFGYNAVSAVLRGMGDSKNPLIFIAIAAAFNLIGDLIFIVLFDMGATGTAIATVMGQGISLVLSVCVLYRRRDLFGFDFRIKSFRIDKNVLQSLMKLGLPMAVRTGSVTVVQIVMFGYVNLYGLTAAAAYSIGDKIIHLSNIFAFAARQAGSGMVGQNIGAGKKERVPRILCCVLIITVSAAFLLSAASLLFPRTIFGLFTNEDAVLTYAPLFMKIICLVFLFASIQDAFDCIVSGTGAVMLAFFGGILDGIVLRIFFSFLFAVTFDMGIAGFLLGEAMARLGPLFIGVIYYATGAWKKRNKLISD